MDKRTFERQVAALDLGIKVNVEVLGYKRQETEINVDAPRGSRFSGTGTHYLCGHWFSEPDMALEVAWLDLKENLPLEPCDNIDNCDICND